MDEKISKILLSLTGSNEILGTQMIQDLWSGYGQLTRVMLDNTSVIVKLIKYPTTEDHPRGWNSDNSHKRKVKSYQVEIDWYQNFNKNIDFAYSPQFIASGKAEGSKFLILQDLAQLGFSPKTTVSNDEIKLCLKWLARFHEAYLNTRPKELWDIGTYWHLDTRPDELNSLDDQELKRAAPLIDQKLNSSNFKTLVHGDAKLTNFLFNDESASAVDFQYVGAGVGIKDVAYFLSSVYSEEELFKYEEESLNYYFKELNSPAELENEWRELYPLAWCDFYRFLKGWSPSHYKLNKYSENMKDKALKCL